MPTSEHTWAPRNPSSVRAVGPLAPWTPCDRRPGTPASTLPASVLSVTPTPPPRSEVDRKPKPHGHPAGSRVSHRRNYVGVTWARPVDGPMTPDLEPLPHRAMIGS